MKHCRNCEEWYLTKPYMGNCRVHHWKNDKYSEDAEAGDCKDFVDRAVRYASYYEVASRKEA